MKIILSCTSTYERRDTFFYGIQSLLKQTVKPDLFIVNLSGESYLQDSGFSSLPGWLEDERILINWVDNTGPYRKLLPALKYADEDDLIVTADDDIIYKKEWLRGLVDLAHEAPNSIICAYARKMRKNFINDWQNYGKWDLVKNKTKDKFLLPIGAGGVGYKKNLIDLDFLTDSSFLKVAPLTDDLWFKVASLRLGTSVLADPKVFRKCMFINHGLGLEQQNYSKSLTFNLSALPYEVQHFKNRIVDYLGINRTNNDVSWAKISKYCTE